MKVVGPARVEAYKEVLIFYLSFFVIFCCSFRGLMFMISRKSLERSLDLKN